MTAFSTQFKSILDTIATQLKAKVSLTGNQTIAGTKTFSSVIVGTSPSSGDNSTNVATTAWVQTEIESKSLSYDPVEYFDSIYNTSTASTQSIELPEVAVTGI